MAGRTLMDYPVGAVLTRGSGVKVTVLDHGKTNMGQGYVKVRVEGTGETCLHNANGSWLSRGKPEQLARIKEGTHSNLKADRGDSFGRGINPNSSENLAALTAALADVAAKAIKRERAAQAELNPLYW